MDKKIILKLLRVVGALVLVFASALLVMELISKKPSAAAQKSNRDTRICSWPNPDEVLVAVGSADGYPNCKYQTIRYYPQYSK